MNGSAQAQTGTSIDVTVRQLVFTQTVAAWGRLVENLGARVVERFDDYAEYALPGGGLLGVHRTGDVEAVGSCALQIVTSDFDTARAALIAHAVAGRDMTEDFGRVFDVDLAPERPQFALVEGKGAPAWESGALMATPLSLVRDIGASVTMFEALGLTPILRSEAGIFAQLVAGGGEVLVHEGGGGASLSFQVDDVEVLRRRGEQSGVEVTIVDESYGRTAFIDAPDGPQVWVNEKQRDFYGYERV